MGTIRTRTAPSPTGFLHIGTARLSLFNYLFAKKHGGVFVVRIEDTDVKRSEKKFEADIFESIRWLGIEADESPEVGGPFGPYRQSERTEMYALALEKLLADGHAIYCFEPESELAIKEGNAEGIIFRPHICRDRNLSREEAEERMAMGENAIIRFKNPHQETQGSFKAIECVDIIRGLLAFPGNILGDFSIAKNLQTPLYNFAVVVDDHEMKISHVLRGEDHIANTPKQILIWKALWPNEPLPEFAHLPLILAPDRSKLSKRYGATSIREFREQGYLPEALVNFMALLGWNPGTDREIFSLKELEQEFSLEHVQKSGAIFNVEKLDWMNGEYIRSLPIERLAELAKSYLPEETRSSPLLEKIITLEQPRLKKLSELSERTLFFFQQPEYDASLLRWKSMSDQDVAVSLERSKQILETLLDADFNVDSLSKRFLDEIGAGDKGELLWPLRAALSSLKASPGPFEILAILGKKESSQRIQTAISKLQKK